MLKPLRRRAPSRLVKAVRRRFKPAPRAARNTPKNPRKRARSDPRFTAQFWRIGRILLGPGRLPDRPSDLRWDGDLAQAVTTEAARADALATFARMLGRGAALEEAQVATIRGLLAVKRKHSLPQGTGRGLALGLASARARHLGLALLLQDMTLPALAWVHLSQVDENTLARLVPVEAVDCALTVGTPEAVAAARRIGGRAPELATRDVIALSGRFLVTGHPDLARALVEEADRRQENDLDAVVDGQEFSAREVLDNVRRWTHPAPSGDEAAAPAGAVRVAVIDYHQPDLERASRNIGDYVQTLAMLGNLARFQQARFTGRGGLGATMASLQRRVRPGLRIDGGNADVHLLPVSRDFSEGEDVPESTWMVAFGWHMHSLFKLRFGLPYHPNVNPIFVSFHLNSIKVLTPEAVEYLKEHGPIGCRDWSTVYLLQSAGVDAFFTGCLSTTVDAVFPELDDVEREQPGVVAVIDARGAGVKGDGPVEHVSHGDPRYRTADLVEGVRLGLELLETYQRRYRRVVTSRLHAYLPATALGLPVDFRPRKSGDVRFDGLLGMTPEAPAFGAMRDRIRRLLAATFERILAGADRDEIYAYWRELTAAEVEEARRRHAAPLPADESVPPLDVPALVETVRAGARAFGPHDAVARATVTDVALALDANLKRHLPTTLESLIGNAGGPLRLWFLSRGLDEAYQRWISDAWPDVPMTFLNLDGSEYGPVARMIPHTTVSTMDRLVLPDLLSDLDRITYVDIDTVTEGDVCELAATDLRGHPLAARTSVWSVSETWRRASAHLPPEQASDLRRLLSARHAFDFKNFNAGVLVLDLARMRTDDFTATHLFLVTRFGLHDQEVLNAYVGRDRAELDERWNVMPMLQVREIAAPGVIHFAGPLKPWDEELTPFRDRWQHYAARVRARVGEPPA
ncbi:MAG TPA: glycosyltransferase [Gaiellaceae bacterium]|nr:glycosyltransferase [Gaiellaceae bacterium]